MTRKALAVSAATVAAAMLGAGIQAALAGPPHRHGYEPKLNPKNFVRVIDNPYFPLPVGRTLIYRGVKDGKTQVDRVHVTAHTRVLEGITATAVSDVSTHKGHVLEKTTDWYAQDKQGNVWYLGERTAEFLPGGKIDRSGSWLAGVHDGEPGIIMLAHPQVPDAYRQEYLKGSAEDTAWIVVRGGSLKTRLGTLRHTLSSLEFSRLEPDVIDQKIYARGIGIVSERAVHGPAEVSKIVSVRG
jgi:hypothetical protein